MSDLKHFGLKMTIILIIAPVFGLLMLRFVEKYSQDWNSGNRRKRWMILSGLFVFLASMGGWLQ